MPRGGHGGGARHHGGGPRGSARGWGRGGRPGPRGWYGWPYPYPAVTEYVEGESDLDRRLKEAELLERMQRLAAGKMSVSGFEMPSMSTLLIIGGAAAAYLLLRKR